MSLKKNEELSNENYALLIKNYLLETSVPPHVLIKKTGEILYSTEKLFLNANRSDQALNIFEMAPPELVVKLRAGLSRAMLRKKEVSYSHLVLNQQKNITLKIIPVINYALHDLFLIMITESELVAGLSEESEILAKMNLIIDLEMELQDAKAKLKMTREKREGNKEVLENTKAELQCSNEEWRSSNEEVETSKETLYFLNTELTLANVHLQKRIDQLATVNDDMTSLFNSADVAAIFLDMKLRVKRFTAKAQEHIYLIPSDHGRPLSHFATSIHYDGLIEDAKTVLQYLIPKTLEVQNKNLNWYRIRLFPYATGDQLEGVVITFSDISSQRESEEKLLHFNEISKNALINNQSLLDSIPEAYLILDDHFNVRSANSALYKLLDLKPEAVINQNIFHLNQKQFDLPELHQLLKMLTEKDVSFEAIEVEYMQANMEVKILALHGQKVLSSDQAQNIILNMVEKWHK